VHYTRRRPNDTWNRSWWVGERFGSLGWGGIVRRESRDVPAFLIHLMRLKTTRRSTFIFIIILYTAWVRQDRYVRIGTRILLSLLILWRRTENNRWSVGLLVSSTTEVTTKDFEFLRQNHNATITSVFVTRSCLVKYNMFMRRFYVKTAWRY